MTSPTPWFLGTVQTDPGEWDHTGDVFSPPSKEEQGREAAGGYPAEPYLVARCDHRPDAELIVRAVNAHEALVDALDRLARAAEAQSRPSAYLCNWPAMAEQARAALALAKGDAAP